MDYKMVAEVKVIRRFNGCIESLRKSLGLPAYARLVIEGEVKRDAEEVVVEAGTVIIIIKPSPC